MESSRTERISEPQHVVASRRCVRVHRRWASFWRVAALVHGDSTYIQAEDWQFLRRVYQGKVPDAIVIRNIARFAELGALTAALNWYRALDLHGLIGVVTVPTLFVWGTEDLAVGEVAAVNTASHVRGPYVFERLQGRSHWLLDETPIWIATQLRQHLESVRGSAP